LAISEMGFRRQVAAHQISVANVRFGSLASFRASWPMSAFTPKATVLATTPTVANCQEPASPISGNLTMELPAEMPTFRGLKGSDCASGGQAI
jgi:hypothetical protein